MSINIKRMKARRPGHGKYFQVVLQKRKMMALPDFQLNQTRCYPGQPGLLYSNS